MGQELIQHGKLGSKYIHKVTNWRFQDTASRMDVGLNQFTVSDVDKMCYDMQTSKYYVLESVHPSSGVPTWYEVAENLGAGEANTASSVGTGATVVAGKVGTDLQFKSLKGSTNIGITVSATEITLDFLPPPSTDYQLLVASEILVAGNYVNVWSDAGVFKVRKSDGSTIGKEADGYVLANVALNAVATVYFEGTNTAVSGMTPGKVYLGSTPGAGSNTPLSTVGQTLQLIGFATSATSVNFNCGDPINL